MTFKAKEEDIGNYMILLQLNDDNKIKKAKSEFKILIKVILNADKDAILPIVPSKYSSLTKIIFQRIF